MCKKYAQSEAEARSNRPQAIVFPQWFMHQAFISNMQMELSKRRFASGKMLRPINLEQWDPIRLLEKTTLIIYFGQIEQILGLQYLAPSRGIIHPLGQFTHLAILSIPWKANTIKCTSRISENESFSLSHSLCSVAIHYKITSESMRFHNAFERIQTDLVLFGLRSRRGISVVGSSKAVVSHWTSKLDS